MALSPKHIKQAAQCTLPSGNSNRAAILRLIGKAAPKELMPPSIHLSMQVCMNELVIKFDAPEGQETKQEIPMVPLVESRLRIARMGR